MNTVDSPSGRVPLPLEKALERMKLAGPAPPLEQVLEGVVTNRRLLQDFTRLDESLEAELSNLCWQSSGLLLFVENDVPYAINNNSQLSDQASELLFRSCLECVPGESIKLLELGAGTALFARFLLDAFRDRCKDTGHDFYERLTFYITDRSPSTVRQWAERRLFADHEDHVVIGVCDALDPLRCTPLNGSPVDLSGIRAVFCNYLLDTLPSTVIRRGEQGCEELCVRTHLTDDIARLKHHTRLTPEEIRALVQSPDPADRAKLTSLVSVFEYETAFRRNGRVSEEAEEALAIGAGLDRVLVNHGGLRCLEKCIALLEPAGFVLVNDYGPVQPDQIPGQAVPQRFGRTIALGVNFPLLQHRMAALGCVTVKPDEDDARSIHTRLILKTRFPGVVEAFGQQFGLEEQLAEKLPEQARQHIEAGRQDEAMDCYKRALARHPRDWRLLGELAEFLIRNIADYDAGLAAARAAVRLNPWYSAWLWNTVGDALYAKEEFEEAHEAYLQGLRIDPNDVRTNLNLAYTFCGFGEYREALNAVARGLAADAAGVFRDRLLEKQQNILATLAARSAAEGEWLNRRTTRLRA